MNDNDFSFPNFLFHMFWWNKSKLKAYVYIENVCDMQVFQFYTPKKGRETINDTNKRNNGNNNNNNQIIISIKIVFTCINKIQSKNHSYTEFQSLLFLYRRYFNKCIGLSAAGTFLFVLYWIRIDGYEFKFR